LIDIAELFSSFNYTMTMITPKELTDQAFALYRKILDVEGLSSFSSHRAKRLRQLADRAFHRYTRRKNVYENFVEY